MIKRILVALDPDSDTPVATRYAVDIARRFDAEVVGLAVVDMGHIEAGARGGGIGSMYYADKLRESLTAEARDAARQLIEAFRGSLEDTGVRYTQHVEEGVPFQRIVEDMKYHDLLIVGDDPHFFYSRPKQRTETLGRVVKETVAPTLIVEKTFQPVERVLIAYDGSPPSARTMQRFANLQPFGTNVQVHILTIYKGDSREAELLLGLAEEYLRAHGFEAESSAQKGDDPDEQIVDCINQFGADIVVAGAHSVSKIKQLAFGSTTASLLNNSPVPLFLHH